MKTTETILTGATEMEHLEFLTNAYCGEHKDICAQANAMTDDYLLDNILEELEVDKEEACMSYFTEMSMTIATLSLMGSTILLDMYLEFHELTRDVLKKKSNWKEVVATMYSWNYDYQEVALAVAWSLENRIDLDTITPSEFEDIVIKVNEITY